MIIENIRIITILSAGAAGFLVAYGLLSGTFSLFNKRAGGIIEDRLKKFTGAETAKDVNEKQYGGINKKETVDTLGNMAKSSRNLLTQIAGVTRLDTFLFTEGNVKRIQVRLAHAGTPHGWSAEEFLAFQMVIAFFAGCYGIIGWMSGFTTPFAAISVVVAALAGPTFYIGWRIKGRHADIVAELPTFINTLILASMGQSDMRSALAIVCDYTKGILTDEVRQTLTEINVSPNISVRDGFMAMAGRIGENQVTAFIMSLVNQMETDAGVEEILREQEEMLYELRIQRAETIINKSTTYMLGAMALATFSNLVLAMGPGAVMMIEQFTSATAM